MIYILQTVNAHKHSRKKLKSEQSLQPKLGIPKGHK